MVGRLLQPVNSFLVILLHTFAIFVAMTEVILSTHESIFGSQLPPANALRPVLGHPVAVSEAPSEISLVIRTTSLSLLANPFDSTIDQIFIVLIAFLELR